MRLQRLEYLVFYVFFFSGSFNDQIALSKLGQIKRGGDARQSRVAVLGGHRAFGNLAVHVFRNQRLRCRKGICAHIIQPHMIPGACKNMGDPIAHLPRADNANLLNIHNGSSDAVCVNCVVSSLCAQPRD